MKSINILDVKITAETKEKALEHIESLLNSEKKTHITTPNPEIILKAQRKKEFEGTTYKEILNNADIALPDGAGLQWAASFLHKKGYIQNSKYLNFIIADINAAITTLQFLFSKKARTKHIPERITGADTVLDIARIAEKNNKSIYLFGAGEGVAQKAAEKLTKKFPKLKIAGTHSGYQINNEELVAEINFREPDILLVALGAPKQEIWISQNLPKLDTVKLAMGVGGTFDFLSEKIQRAPKLYQSLNIEWLWRLKQEPSRKARIYDAVIKFPLEVIWHTVHQYRPYRPNVLSVIINSDKEFLILNNSYIYSKDKEDSHWQFLQGGKRPYESDEKAVLRESKEEMGSSQLQILKKADQGYQYDWPPKHNVFKRPFKGQKQSIFFVKYTGNGSDVKIRPKEHSDFKWVKQEEVLQYLHPVRHESAKVIFEELEKHNILENL